MAQFDPVFSQCISRPYAGKRNKSCGVPNAPQERMISRRARISLLTPARTMSIETAFRPARFDSGDMSARKDRQVWSLCDRVDVGRAHAATAAVADCELILTDAFRRRAVEIPIVRVAGLNARRHEPLGRRKIVRNVRYGQRSGAAMKFADAAWIRIPAPK